MRIINEIKDFIASGYYGGASGHIIAGRYNSALNKIQKALKYDPGDAPNPLYMSCLGECYMKLERYDKAIEILEIALQLMETEINTESKENLIDEYSRTSKLLEYSRKHNKSN